MDHLRKNITLPPMLVILLLVLFFSLGKESIAFAAEENFLQATQVVARKYQTQKNFTGNPVIKVSPGGRVTIELSFKNTGTSTWQKSGLQAVFLENKSAKSIFRDPFWKSARRAATIKEKKVAPDQNATFRLTVSAPHQEGTYAENFILRRGGVNIPDSEITLTAHVGVFPFHFGAQHDNPSPYIINIQPGRGISIDLSFQNTGRYAWKKSGPKHMVLGYRSEGGEASALRHRFWPGITTASLLKETEVKRGENGLFRLSLQAPATEGIHEEHFQLKVSDVGFVSGGKVTVLMNVRKDPVIVPEGQPKLLIGLFQPTQAVTLTSDQKYSLKDSKGNVLDTLEANIVVNAWFDGTTYTVATPVKTITSTEYIRFDGTDQNAVFTVTSYENRPSWNTSLNDNAFRGSLLLRYSEKKKELWLIEEVPLELYLRGLAEAGNDNPAEYLKSLLTAARTYAYYHYLYPSKHKDQNFTLGVTAADQVYRGYNFELRTPTITQSVQATEGMIATYDGEIAITPYFSQTDGRTRSWEEVWGGGAKPWLVSVADPCCSGEKMNGHGVGMSATGARYFAEAGETYEEILKYYYTGIELKKWY